MSLKVQTHLENQTFKKQIQLEEKTHKIRSSQSQRYQAKV